MSTVTGRIQGAVYFLCGFTFQLAWMSLLVVGNNPSTSFAAEPERQVLQVGVNLLELASSRQALAILNSDALFLWDQTPLRQGVQELSRVHGISIWLDRRLDPTKLVSTPPVAHGDSSLQARLRQIATAVGGEVGLIENVVYLGPVGQAVALQRAAVELHDAISRVGNNRTAQLRPWRWEELSSSADRLAQLSAQWKIEIAQGLPHDLVHAGELVQPTTLATQLTLLVGGFERQAELTAAGRFELKPLERHGQWQANYRKEDLDLRSLSEFKAEYSGSECQSRGAVSQVRGVTDFHLALLSAAAAARAVGPAVGPRGSAARWGFEVRNTKVEAVLNNLAVSIGFEVQWDAACTPEMRAKLISFLVDGVTTDELLAKVAQASGLKITRDKQQVRVKP